ncbi:hypothetical protein ACFP56_11050 [Paenibacillus septentrionalis]|uniref:YfhE family protein n=1 Tax=Paenibacillus septentrionalis TaxID=429342 RepID=A0ABW1V6X8_9BACL
MSKQNSKQPSKAQVQTTKLNRVVDTESEFATEFGEGLYGQHVREAYKQKQNHKQNNKNNQQ